MDKDIERLKELVKTIDPQVGILDREGIFLYKLAKSLPPGGCIVEIGSWKGRSTIWLAEGGRLSGNITYAIDPHTGTSSHELEGEEDTFRAFTESIKRAGLEGVVRLLRMTSKEAWRSRDWKNIHMVFIDGSHDYKDVLEDYLIWNSFLGNGLLAFHDTIGYEGPRKLVDNYIFRGRFWEPIGVCGQIVVARGRIVEPNKIWNYLMWTYWKLYSLGFLLLKKLPKSWKEKLK